MDSTTLQYPICGVWIDEHDDIGEKILDYVRTTMGKSAIRVNLNQLSFPRDWPKHTQYCALISKESLADHEFKVFLTQILYKLHQLKLISNVVLIILDDGVEKTLPETLTKFERINISSSVDDNDLQEICKALSKSTEPSRATKDILPAGDAGIGLAWSYFYGYLALILPGIRDRIENSEVYEQHSDRMSTQFIIVIPESCKTPASFKEVDKRFESAGPLDKGFQRSRAGHPHRTYKNFVHKIKGAKAEENYYFCGEFATPLMAMKQMHDHPLCDMNDEEMEKQRDLFKRTLLSILDHERNLECKGQARIYDYADRDRSIDLADELCKIIDKQRRNP